MLKRHREIRCQQTMSRFKQVCGLIPLRIEQADTQMMFKVQRECLIAYQQVPITLINAVDFLCPGALKALLKLSGDHFK